MADSDLSSFGPKLSRSPRITADTASISACVMSGLDSGILTISPRQFLLLEASLVSRAMRFPKGRLLIRREFFLKRCRRRRDSPFREVIDEIHGFAPAEWQSEEHTSELKSLAYLV